jgi:hypothetical protein
MRTMNSRRSSTLRMMLATTAFAALTSCEDNAVSFFIRANMAPQPSGSGCTITNDPSAPTLPEGRFDVAAADSYSMSPLFQSNIFPRFDMTANRAETNHVFVQGIVVEVHVGEPTGPILDRAFTVFQTTTVSPGATATFGVTSIEVIPPAITRLIRPRVCSIDLTGVTAACPVPKIISTPLRLILRVSAFGRTGGNVAVETPQFDYPVTATCAGLRAFPQAPAGSMVNPRLCLDTDTRLPSSCWPDPQDSTIACRDYCNSRLFDFFRSLDGAPVETLRITDFCNVRGYSPTGATDCPTF